MVSNQAKTKRGLKSTIKKEQWLSELSVEMQLIQENGPGKCYFSGKMEQQSIIDIAICRTAVELFYRNISF